MEKDERLMKWKQEVIEDITILQRRIGVKNEEIEKLKAEFLMETRPHYINERKNRLYEALDKQKRPEIKLWVAAVKIAKNGDYYDIGKSHKIDNILYDTNLIEEVKPFCTEKSRRQLCFYMEKGRDTHRGYETIARKDVTREVNLLLNGYSFHTAYELRNEGECMNYE